MSCGCSSAKASDIATEPLSLLTPYQLPNETTECFMQRMGDQPAAPEPGSKTTPDKIKTLYIPVDCDLKVDTTFEMTQDSKGVTWEFEFKDENGNVVDPSTVGLTYTTGDNPTLKGAFPQDKSGKKYSAHMKAKAKEANPDLGLNVGDVVDEKEYSIKPVKCDKETLRLIHPNPKGIRTSKFGPRTPPTAGASSFHKGTDYSTGGKAQIIAAGDGVVTSYSGVHSRYGNLVEISHTNSAGKELARTRYAHLSQVFVEAGDKVASGQPIGHEGNTGIGTGAHLHFEVLINGVQDDPEKYINGTITAAAGSDEGVVQPEAIASTPTTTTTSSNKGITSSTGPTGPTGDDCPMQPLQEAAAAVDKKPPTPGEYPPATGGADCKPSGWTPPPTVEVAKQIRDAARAEGASDADIRYLLKIAYLESSYNQYAKNKNSTALGLYQMLDGTAKEHFGAIGIPPTCENRCNIQYATKAMMHMVKLEAKGYDTFKANGTIAGANKGLVNQNAYTQNYGNLSRDEFMYMEHGQGQEGMRKGTAGGSNFYNHFKAKAPSDSTIDGYMNA